MPKPCHPELVEGSQVISTLANLPEGDRRRIVTRIEGLQNNLAGDVKKLTNFTPEYRLRVGDYRALFEIEGPNVVVYRVLHRREVYR